MLRSKIENIILSKYSLLFEELSSRLEPAISVKFSNKKHNLGSSKLGGKPDVSTNFVWPTFQDRYLSFMGQLNLTDISKIWKESYLPKHGILYFFMDTGGKNGYPNLTGQFKVIFNAKENKDNLEQYQNNLETTIFQEISLDFHQHYTLRKDNDYNSEIDDIIDDLSNDISEITGHNTDEGHQIGGFPFSLQNAVFYWWSLNEKKFVYNNINREQKKELAVLNEEFYLLFQINFSDRNTNFSDYGGDGIAYYGIKKKDLNELNFNNIYFVCQN